MSPLFLVVGIGCNVCIHSHSIQNIYDEPSLPTNRDQVSVILDKPHQLQELELCIPSERQRESGNNDYRDTPTPPVPPRGYSVSSSLDKLENLEAIELQHLSNKLRSQDQDSTVTIKDEKIYQPLIPPRPSNDDGSSEYQSLVVLHQDAPTPGLFKDTS